jgi:hypothetical protein
MPFRRITETTGGRGRKGSWMSIRSM